MKIREVSVLVSRESVAVWVWLADPARGYRFYHRHINYDNLASIERLYKRGCQLRSLFEMKRLEILKNYPKKEIESE